LEEDLLPAQTNFDPAGNDWMANLFEGQSFEIDSAFADFPFDISFPALDYTALSPLNDSSLKNTSIVRLKSPPSFNPPLFQNYSGKMSTKTAASNLWGSTWSAWSTDIDTSNSLSEKDLVHQLSTLNIGLYEHIQTIPSQSIYEPDHPKCTYTGADENVLPIYQQYSTDETFKLTQELIDIYPVFIRTFIKCRTSSETSSDDWVAQESLGIQQSGAIVSSSEELARQNLVDKRGSSSCRASDVDHSSVLLLLSCHVRLIDIYDELFKHIEHCMAQGGMPKNAAQARIAVTSLKIGSYQPPPAAAVPMQMLLLVQLASQLANSASDLTMHIREHVPSTIISPRDETAMLSLVTADKVTERAANMSARLTEVRTQLLGSGFLA
jgi:hypothetical protein